MPIELEQTDTYDYCMPRGSAHWGINIAEMCNTCAGVFLFLRLCAGFAGDSAAI